MIVNRHEELARLREKMAGYAGKTFTEEMRQSIRMDATELMNTAYDEGQAAMAPHCCGNAGTSECPQYGLAIEGLEDYEPDVCRQCNLDGGFSI